MRVLIIKLGATGDVLRTTTLLRIFTDEVDWITSEINVSMLSNADFQVDTCAWEDAGRLRNKKYDLVINLEDTAETAGFLRHIEYGDLYGAYLDNKDKLVYTESSREWFDLSLISRFGRKKADELKLLNRKSYQELIFNGLGYQFDQQKYVMPDAVATDLKGDVAIAPKAGSVWPMKNWAFYDDLSALLEKKGFTVNYLPQRATLLQHMGDINNHRYLISGDSLPMHIALGLDLKCITLFICTSPWEIHDYGIQKKIISPRLGEFFYKRINDRRATTSITIDQVLNTFDELIRS